MQKGREAYEKRPYTHRKIKKCKMTTQNLTKHFDHTTIANRLTTVKCSNDSHLAGMYKPVYGIPTFPLTIKAL